MTATQGGREYLGVDEVAALLDLRPVTIYRWCRAGRLAGVKLGKEWRIPRAALDELLRPAVRQRAADRAYEDVPMDELSPAARALARRLLLHEAGGLSWLVGLSAQAGVGHGAPLAPPGDRPGPSIDDWGGGGARLAATAGHPLDPQRRSYP